MSITADPREGKPSASIMGRLYQCPGSWRMSGLMAGRSSQSKTPNESAVGASEAANIGTRVHLALMGQEPIQLSGYEQTIVQKCQARQVVQLGKAAEELRRMNPDWDINHPKTERLYEQRLWSGLRYYSGQADLIILNREQKWAIVWDYKALTGKVEPAETNMQLRCLATLVDYEFGDLDAVIAGIIQPSKGDANIVVYDRMGLSEASVQMVMLCADILDNPNLHAGEWCQHCPARAYCRVAQAHIAEKLLRAGKVEDMTPDELVTLCDLIPMGRSLFDAVERRVKGLLTADPDRLAEYGYRLRPGQRTKRITDLEAAWEILKNYMPQSGFMSCLVAQNGALEELFSKCVENAKLADSKEASDKLLWSLLKPVTEIKENKPSIDRS